MTTTTETAIPQQRSRNSFDSFLNQMLSLGASDLHLTVGQTPRIRVDGELQPLPGRERNVMNDVFMKGVAHEYVLKRDTERFAKFEATRELDTSYSLLGTNDVEAARFRVNLSYSRGSIALVARAIPVDIVELSALGLPNVVSSFAGYPNGLVLVTGPTGSGKTTTLASLINMINRQRKEKIVTIEDRIEFVHKPIECDVIQREVGSDTMSFANALRASLRQDPDIILLGEMRDPETIETALTAAETGHLVFATVHTQSAKDTITRVVNSFPSSARDSVRSQLANSLKAVLTQTLCRKIGGGRVAATEIMVVNNAVRSNITDNEINQINNSLLTGKDIGSQLLEDSLADLVNRRIITEKTAISKARDLDELRSRLSNDIPTRPNATSSIFD